jgi:hypothetical protein
MTGRYEPLREPRQIRLLELLPGKGRDPIRCELSVARLPGAIRFEALSYVWGGDTPMWEIYLDGWPVLIRENLWQFLAQWRHHTNSATLWIDALCINQESLAERSQQVQFMGDIYKSATRVLAWLGPGNPSCDLVMDIMAKVQPRSPAPETFNQDSTLSAMAEWCSNPYWSRTWVIQEFLLTQSANLVCGNRLVDWKPALWLFQSLKSLGRSWPKAVAKSILESPVNDLLRQMLERYDASCTTSSKPLASLILANGRSKCLDPLDRVYALLSLASDCYHGHTIEVDYTKSAKILFREVLTFCEIPSRDIFPFAEALAEILTIGTADHEMPFEPAWLPTEALRVEKRNTALANWDGKAVETAAFRTGYVVHSEPLSESDLPGLCFKMSFETHLNLLQNLRLRAPNCLSMERLASLICNLETVSLQRLMVGFDVLTAISERSWGTSSAQSDHSTSASRKLSVVVLYFSRHRSKRFSLGLACGNVKKGDHVLQIPRYEVSFSATCRPTCKEIRDPSLLSGKIISARDHAPWTDPTTGTTLAFEAIKTEAELQSDSDQMRLCVTPRELLALCARVRLHDSKMSATLSNG